MSCLWHSCFHSKCRASSSLRSWHESLHGFCCLFLLSIFPYCVPLPAARVSWHIQPPCLQKWCPQETWHPVQVLSFFFTFMEQPSFLSAAFFLPQQCQLWCSLCLKLGGAWWLTGQLAALWYLVPPVWFCSHLWIIKHPATAVISITETLTVREWLQL